MDVPLAAIMEITEEYFTKLSDNANQECFFLAQDGDNVCNSGFWIMKNNSWSLDFVNEWLSEFEMAGKHVLSSLFLFSFRIFSLLHSSLLYVDALV